MIHGVLECLPASPVRQFFVSHVRVKMLPELIFAFLKHSPDIITSSSPSGYRRWRLWWSFVGRRPPGGTKCRRGSSSEVGPQLCPDRKSMAWCCRYFEQKTPEQWWQWGLWKWRPSCMPATKPPSQSRKKGDRLFRGQPYHTSSPKDGHNNDDIVKKGKQLWQFKSVVKCHHQRPFQLSHLPCWWRLARWQIGARTSTTQKMMFSLA